MMAISGNMFARMAGADRKTVTRACRRGDLPPRPAEGWPDDQLADLLASLRDGMAAARVRSRANLSLRWRRPRRRSDPVDTRKLLSLAEGWCIEPSPPLPDPPRIILENE